MGFSGDDDQWLSNRYYLEALRARAGVPRVELLANPDTIGNAKYGLSQGRGRDGGLPAIVRAS